MSDRFTAAGTAYGAYDLFKIAHRPAQYDTRFILDTHQGPLKPQENP